MRLQIDSNSSDESMVLYTPRLQLGAGGVKSDGEDSGGCN